MPSDHTSLLPRLAKRVRRIRGVVALTSLVAIISAPSARARANDTSAREKPANAGTNPRDVASGKAIFAERCAICHYSASAAQKIGPGLDGLYARMRFAGGEKVKDAVVTHWIENGGKNMPGFKDVLKPAEIRALIAYLKTL